MSDALRRESAVEYFKELVEGALAHQRISAGELTSFYVVNLLTGFLQRPAYDAHAVRAGLAELDDILDEAIGLGLRRLDDRRIRLPMQRRILLGSLARERMIFRAKSRSVASSIW